MQIAILLNVFKYHHDIPSAGLLANLHLAASLCLTLLAVLWSRLRVGSYLRWREVRPLCSHCRLACTCVHPRAVRAVWRCATNHWRRPGLLAQARLRAAGEAQVQ